MTLLSIIIEGFWKSCYNKVQNKINAIFVFTRIIVTYILSNEQLIPKLVTQNLGIWEWSISYRILRLFQRLFICPIFGGVSPLRVYFRWFSNDFFVTNFKEGLFFWLLGCPQMIDFCRTLANFPVSRSNIS